MSRVRELMPASVRDSIFWLADRSARLGALVDRQRPSTFVGWDDGFNGQRERRRMMGEIVRGAGFDAFVETGTRHGATAAYVRRKFDLEVWTVEVVRRSFELCRWRFRGEPGIHLHHGDSRAFIRQVATPLRGRRCLFYLDAHWYADLPLFEELRIVADRWEEWVIVIDDFRVDDDPKYYYDHYGEGRALEAANLPEGFLDACASFFPSASGMEDNFPWRGCIVLARGAEFVAALERCETLRPAQPAIRQAREAEHKPSSISATST